MDIRQLEVFVCVAEHLNFTNAAKHLYLTQSTVSLQIAEIEKQLGLKLFVRTTHSVKLTVAGEFFLKEAKSIIANYEAAVTHTRQTASGYTGALKVAFLESHTKHFLPHLVRRFRHSYPHISLSVTQLPWDELNRGLERGELDVGLTMDVSLENKTNIDWQIAYKDIECWVLPYDHPIVRAPYVDLAAVAREPFIVINRDSGHCPNDFTIHLCANRGFTPNIVQHPRLTETLLMLVEAGEGISILPYITKKIYAGPGLRFIPLEGRDAQVAMVAAWNKANINPSIPLFVKETLSVTQFCQHEFDCFPPGNDNAAAIPLS